jgi:hypothetical protein
LPFVIPGKDQKSKFKVQFLPNAVILSLKIKSGKSNYMKWGDYVYLGLHVKEESKCSHFFCYLFFKPVADKEANHKTRGSHTKQEQKSKEQWSSLTWVDPEKP